MTGLVEKTSAKPPFPGKLPRSERSARWPWVVVSLVAGAGILVLFLFNPAESGFYPFCMFHRLTGFQCPGCGGLRAMHQLLHGHLSAAFQLNPLLVLAIPWCAWVAAHSTIRRRQGRPAEPAISGWAVWSMFAVLVLFGVLRNI